MKSIFSILLLSGCATLGQSTGALNPDAVFKKTLAFTVNGKTAVGTMTVPAADTYRIDAVFPAKPEVVKISTCHKQVVVEKPTTNTFFIGAIKGLEDSGYCPVRIDAIDLGGVNSSAYFEIENETLDAFLLCDGENRKTKGVTVCQAKAGMTQRILFFEEVNFEKMSPDCADMTPMKQLGYGYDFNISKGECVYLFHGKKSDTFHRVTTIGYSDIFFKTIKPSNQ